MITSLHPAQLKSHIQILMTWVKIQSRQDLGHHPGEKGPPWWSQQIILVFCHRTCQFSAEGRETKGKCQPGACNRLAGLEGENLVFRATE